MSRTISISIKSHLFKRLLADEFSAHDVLVDNIRVEERARRVGSLITIRYDTWGSSQMAEMATPKVREALGLQSYQGGEDEFRFECMLDMKGSRKIEESQAREFVELGLEILPECCKGVTTEMLEEGWGMDGKDWIECGGLNEMCWLNTKTGVEISYNYDADQPWQIIQYARKYLGQAIKEFKESLHYSE